MISLLLKLTPFLFGMNHRRLSFKYNLLNYRLSQKFKLLRYGKFNHLTNTSNIPLTRRPKLPFNK